jgi:hypothetical protein
MADVRAWRRINSETVPASADKQDPTRFAGAVSERPRTEADGEALYAMTARVEWEILREKFD